LQGAAGYARSSTADSGPVARAYGRVIVFRPLPNQWHATARVEVGQVFAKRSVGVPDTLLFRAGGDESVRGYEYRSLGPVVNGAVTSGRSLLTASAEVARPISQRMPQLWGAAFVDAGDAAARFSDLRPKVGVGVGVRYRSPVGPLKVDVAYGVEERKVRLHLSAGMSF
jgi:translocation and assembly module TamA